MFVALGTLFQRKMSIFDILAVRSNNQQLSGVSTNSFELYQYDMRFSQLYIEKDSRNVLTRDTFSNGDISATVLSYFYLRKDIQSVGLLVRETFFLHKYLCSNLRTGLCTFATSDLLPVITIPLANAVFFCIFTHDS